MKGKGIGFMLKSCLKKVNYILTILIYTSIFLFIVHCLYVILNYKTYIMYSAPWYTSIFIYAITTFIFLCIAFTFKLVIRKHIY